MASLIVKEALRVVSSEMRSYDSLAKQPKYRRVESQYQVAERQRSSPDLDVNATQKCAHGVWLHEQCTKCGRLDLPWSDCQPYREAMLRRLAKHLQAIK